MTPSPIAPLADLVRRILTIVGHTPEEVEQHTQTLLHTVMTLALQHSIENLSTEQQQQVEERLLQLNTTNGEQMEGFVQDLINMLPPGTYEQNIETVTTGVLQSYVTTMQESLSSDQQQQIFALLKEEAV